MKKPYHSIPIQECGEKLCKIPSDIFCLNKPHIYESRGAPYNGISPWSLRENVLSSLINAQNQLSKMKPGWKIKIYDAYRPLSVYAFLVENEMKKEAAARGLNYKNLSQKERDLVESNVLRFWGVATDNSLTPPPHSTGAAMDITLTDENGKEIDMGAMVDETNEKAAPDFFKDKEDASSKFYHTNRELLKTIMLNEGFVQHHNEWWHFSKGDQLAVWIQQNILKNSKESFAIYGRADV